MTRPALVPVLAVLTTCDAAWWYAALAAYGPLHIGGLARVAEYPHPTPAEALETLATAGLLPAHWTDAARAPRWWCEECGERGERHTTTTPPSHAAVVAVVALGLDALARAEALVAMAWPGRQVVWRVMTRKVLRDHHRRISEIVLYSPTENPVVAFSVEEVARQEALDAGVPEADTGAWEADPDELHGAEVRRVWRTIRALAVAEGGTSTGFHLVALDAARVTLAVEALS